MNHIEKMSFYNAKNNMVLQTCQNVSDGVHPFDLTTLKLESEVADLDLKIQNYLHIINPVTSSAITAELELLDNQRDHIVRGLYKEISNASLHINAERKSAAHELQLVLDAHHAHPESMTYSEETAEINSLLEELKKPELANQIALLHVDEWMEELEPVNTKFAELFVQRTAEEGDPETGLSKESRKALEDSFAHFCNKVNALAMLEGVAQYQEIIDVVNSEMAHMRAEVKRNQTNNQKRDDKKNKN